MAVEIVHIRPHGDRQEHSARGVFCKCQPMVEAFPDWDGVMVVVSHNSFDGREFAEDVRKEMRQKRRRQEGH